jgi:nitrite reductase (NADH) small subunit
VIRVCGVEDVPLGEGRTVLAAGRRVAVFRAEDGWFALDAACPHRGGPLADGIVARRTVICPLHERRFDLATGHECAGGYRVAAHRLEVRAGDVYLSSDVLEAADGERPPAAIGDPASVG